MYKQRLANFLFAVAMGMTAAIPAYGDDTDIYLSTSGDPDDDAVRPNVLLVLDTSDSMKDNLVPELGKPEAEWKSRLANMREAIDELLTSLTNVNVGLMRFNGHRTPNNPSPYLATGGPVLFPIANLAADASTVMGEAQADNLHFVRLVAQGEDDTEESAGGAMDPDNENLALGNTVGLRFQNVNVPQGVVISSAYIDFTPRDPTGNVNGVFTIQGELDVDGDADPFDTSVNELTVGRLWTAAVPWDLDDCPQDPLVAAYPVDLDPVLYPDPDCADRGITITPTDMDDDNDASTDPANDDDDPANPDTPVDTPTPATISTVDIKDIVQEIVAEGEWCGSQAMAFRIQAVTGLLNVASYDDDPTKAPVLRINYDQTALTAGEGCVRRDYVFQPSNSKDDAYELASNNRVTLTGPILLTRRTNLDGSYQNVESGVRFPSVNIGTTATIVDAAIEFTALNAQSGDAAIDIHGQASSTADPFASSFNNIDNTAIRPRTSDSVTWTPEAVTEGAVFVTPDISAIVDEIINGGTGWALGNDMAFFFSGGNSGTTREATSYDQDAFDAPRLRITTEENLGDGNVSVLDVRARLKEINQQQVFTLNRTPSVETLYEAARYWKGEGVHFARNRGGTFVDDTGAYDSSLTSGPRVPGMRYARVSHPGSYTGGSPEQPEGCSNDNLNAIECKDEYIGGTPVYISPFGAQDCQENYMIFLSDGQPTQNGAITEVQEMIGGACADMATDEEGNEYAKTTEELCGTDLLDYLSNNDLSEEEDGIQHVKTYTIGFNLEDDPLAVQFMRQLATAGGGEYKEADTAASLAGTLKDIFTEIRNEPTSFASPALTVNAFNKLFNRDNVYFSLFEPDVTPYWAGNVKKYNLCAEPDPDNDPETDDVCQLGEVLQKYTGENPETDPASAIDPVSSKILDSAISEWSTEEDGPFIRKGGAGAVIPGWQDRIIHTEAGLTLPVDSPAVGLAMNTLENENYTTNAAFRTAACETPDAGNTVCDELLEWVLGKNVNQEENEAGELLEERWILADPLHSSPVVVTFGGDEDSEVDKVFFGTNGGSLHMLDGKTGIENWSFMPEVMLDIQTEMKADQEAFQHIYGLDATPTVHIQDNDRDGVIDPVESDFVRLYIGMRRGNNGADSGNIYALNVTPSSAMNDPDDASSQITPKFMWRIVGGDPGSDFPRLAQTWSQPKLADVLIDGNTTKTVLIFGGGYDPQLDEGYGTAATAGANNFGNAIYIVDPDDGSLILEISADPNTDNNHLVVSDMKYSIAADITLLDANGDGRTDRLYVGDTAANVWRVDLGANLSASAPGGTVVAKLAALGDAAEVADQRRFFAAASVVQVLDTEFSGAKDEYASDGKSYDMVVITSGDRTNPLNEDVVDRIYAIRDYYIGSLVDADSLTTIVETDLADVTDNEIQVAAEDSDEYVDAVDELRGGYGWYLRLQTGAGEKGLSRPIVLEGKLFVTTFVPTVDVNACSANEGSGTEYGLDLFSAVAKFTWGVDGEGDYTILKRTKVLGGGIPSGPIPVIQEEGITLLIGTGGGAAVEDPEIVTPLKRTYWYQQK